MEHAISMDGLVIFPTSDRVVWSDGNLTVTPLSMIHHSGNDSWSVWARNEADGSKLNFSHKVFVQSFSPIFS